MISTFGAGTSVTAVTITRKRPKLLLQRCLPSVARQTRSVRHLIVVDDCPMTMAALETHARTNIMVRFQRRKRGDRTGPGRSSRLRNWAVRHAQTTWIAFLDDDNEWEPTHLSSLIDIALEEGADAAHAERTVYTADGAPWRDGIWPWSSTDEEGRQLYADYARRGVVTPGSPVIHDGVHAQSGTGAIQMVDTSAWLLRRSLLLRVPFTECFTGEHEAQLLGEDDLLLADLVKAGARIAATGLPTLRYFLGGYSNNRHRGHDPEFSWR